MVRKILSLDMVLSTEWVQVEVIDLINDGNGFGFNIVGGRSTGVVVKCVVPGGVADKDGRLQSGDHVLQLEAVNLRGFSSEQVASVLRQCGPAVRLLVARPVDPSAVDIRIANPQAPIVPTKSVIDPEMLDRHLIENGYSDTYNAIPQCYEVQAVETQNGDDDIYSPIAAVVDVIGKNPTPIGDKPVPVNRVSPIITVTVPEEIPEMEIIHVDLSKNVYGLGITVAGYVCEKEELSGIFVKSIIEGGSAEVSGKIRINDRIVEVDGISLREKTNHQAVEVLKSTGISLHLVLERFLRGPKYEHLQLALCPRSDPPSPPSPSVTTLSWFPVQSDTITEIQPDMESQTTIDSGVLEQSNDDFETSMLDASKSSLEAIKDQWESEMGAEKRVIVAEVQKLSGLGISLEGTVEVEGGKEVRPHHYIRSILPEGPVGQQGSLRAGDELLQVNDYKLHGLKHTEVVSILKKLPVDVRIVCARDTAIEGPRPVINLSQDRQGFEARKIITGSLQNLTSIVKAQSDRSINTISTATLTDHSSLHSKKSRSLECVSGLAMWCSMEEMVELIKGEHGLGFSILDYQDPIDPDGTVIVVRSLIPGGVAERTGGVFPGDRVMSVNGCDVKNVCLERAVEVLKGAPCGVVQIGISRPLPAHDSSRSKSSSKSTVKSCS